MSGSYPPTPAEGWNRRSSGGREGAGGEARRGDRARRGASRRGGGVAAAGMDVVVKHDEEAKDLVRV